MKSSGVDVGDGDEVSVGLDVGDGVSVGVGVAVVVGVGFTTGFTAVITTSARRADAAAPRDAGTLPAFAVKPA